MDSYDIGINFHNYLSSRIFYLLIIIYIISINLPTAQTIIIGFLMVFKAQ